MESEHHSATFIVKWNKFFIGYLHFPESSLYRRRRTYHDVNQLSKVVTQGEVRDIFVSYHASPEGGHFAADKTLATIASRYYWPSMSVDIKKWVS